MSYTKHTGTNGETITAAKLNNIENGIEAGASGGSGLGFVIVTVDFDNPSRQSLNLTGQEIYDANLNSIVALVGSGENSGGYGGEVVFMSSCCYDPYNSSEYPYRVTFGEYGSFTCASPSEYPRY